MQYKEVSGEFGLYNDYDAKRLAENYLGGGFNDWNLPDVRDMRLLYDNLHKEKLENFTICLTALFAVVISLAIIFCLSKDFVCRSLAKLQP